ncbi:MAG TPA: ABC transporter substrate-binding protein [Methylomirabilota bacterium]|nr:ABC transporter substrate-binding protein [Methylomirabilota bacterium]
MTDRRRLVVYEPFRSIFYAPQFVTLYGGHFAAEGLDVEVRTAGGGVTTTGALIGGTAQVSLGGVMRSLDLADRGGPFLVHFAEVNSRNGFFLLGREPRPRFAWQELAGRTVLSFAEAPTPWQCMLTVLRRHGVDPAGVRIERSLPVGEAVAAFTSGHGDFLEVGQPFTEILLAEGRAHLMASMGEATGPLPFSSYMTTTAFLRDERATLLRFTRALQRAQRWLARASAAEVAELIAPAFAGVDPAIRRAAVARYLGQQTWAADPLLRAPGYEYLQQILLDGGFIQRRHRYDDLVDTTLAREVVAAGA